MVQMKLGESIDNNSCLTILGHRQKGRQDSGAFVTAVSSWSTTLLYSIIFGLPIHANILQLQDTKSLIARFAFLDDSEPELSETGDPTRMLGPNFNGGLAQMVERSLSMREALGSMPRSSTLLPGPRPRFRLRV